MFKEITAQLPVNNHDSIIEFQVDLDADNGEAIAVYTDKCQYDDMPVLLKRLKWNVRRNNLFIHAEDPSKAWKYLEEHAFYDLDE
jgi:hypothetical protein